MNISGKFIDFVQPGNSELSEGEIFICEYLKSKRITFEKQVKITNLSGDAKSYRIADFYIPKYKVFIEYFGQWNSSDEAKSRYVEKKNVYFNNRIPCVYLYPENLGIIEYILPTRISKELKKHNLRKELFKHRMSRFLYYKGNALIYLLISIFVLSKVDYTFKDDDYSLLILFLIVALYQLYLIIAGYIKFFIRE